MQAYDLEILPRRALRAVPGCHGWCFGLPPGITPEQWPLDPANGYPLQHSFTLLLPEDYRCHGPEIVAVAFFASPFDLNDGGPRVKAPEIRVAMTSGSVPDDPDLAVFWQAERVAHPRLHRMNDPLNIAHAAILLSQVEFDGPLCRPSPLLSNPYRDRLPSPAWLKVGSAAAYWAFQGYMRSVRDTLGTEPASELEENRAVHWTARTCDPNAGRKPYELDQHEPTDYIQPWHPSRDAEGNETYEYHGWVEKLAPMHIGGTMMPMQSVPDFSPYYMEFGEELGGFNFGDGIAQFDFRRLEFDWACG